MSKSRNNTKTLSLLLLAPFLVGLLTYVGIAIMRNTVTADITDIRWDYGDNEGFQVRSSTYPLKATAVYDPEIKLASGNDLVWSVANVANTDEKVHGDYYFHRWQKPRDFHDRQRSFGKRWRWDSLGHEQD